MPRKPQRSTYHHGDLRNALVQAALELLATGGPEVITLRAVSRLVGVNHRAAYRHFADLAALLAAVAEQGYRELVLTMARALEPLHRSTPERRLEAIGVAYIDFALSHPSHYRIMFGRRLNEEGRFPLLEELVLQAYTVLSTELARGQAAGRFRRTPVREAAFALWSLAHGFASLALVRRIRVKPELLASYSRKIFAPYLAGVRVPPSARVRRVGVRLHQRPE